MTTRSPSPRPDDALISSVAGPAHTSSAPAPTHPQLLTWPAVSPNPTPEVPEEGSPAGPCDPSGGTSQDDAACHGDGPYGDPLHGLVRAAVADRPLEDVVRLITLLENSPEYSRATADALRAVGVDRSVEDLARLVALLTEPPRDSGSADEVVRAAAAGRSLDDVARLVQLLYRTSGEPHCGRAAVQAAANRPIEELAELIGRLSADRPDPETLLLETSLREPVSHEPAWPELSTPGAPLPEPPHSGPAADPPAEPLSASAEPVCVPTAAEPVSTAAEPASASAEPVSVSVCAEPVSVSGEPVSASAESVSTPDDTARVRTGRRGRPGTDRAAKGRLAKGRPGKPGSAQDGERHGWRSMAPAWGLRGAAVLVFLCGVAHAPRSWTGLAHGALTATVLASALCVLLAVVLPGRSVQARLVTGTVALGVTAALTAQRQLGRWFGLPDPTRPWHTTLAPPWLAATAAAVAAIAVLAVLLGTLVAGTVRGERAG
ncbi:hypothetical protein GCM10010260_35430 [Streptomyces filipinensis]|uniref:Uncharacterized protein n=1 Tax=Streptomyces filipinensis TaxID=66887 RepID=A0A918IC03_9ACTN|nr:hypothetical protein [Streptomyces filipinensis]GGU96735.1 hypothetical protein GCM10010260_35430 [Streptomyces filipinensis]